MNLGNFFLDWTIEIRNLARQIFKPSVSSDSQAKIMCNNMGFLENLLSGDFGGHFFIFKLIFYATESRWNWFYLGASPFSLISYWNLYFTIWFQNYLNFIPGLRWTGRRPRTRTSQTMNRTETTVLEKFWDVMRRPALHNTLAKTRTFPENSRKSLSSVVIVLVLVFVLGRPMKISKKWRPIGNEPGRLIWNWN